MTWVTNKRVENNISVYGGFQGKTYTKPMFYRLVVSYSGKDWIFFEKMIVITDSGRYVIDAKSIMGIFSLDLSKPIDLNIHAEDNVEQILEALSPYIINK